jgi:hypothetical protein
MISNFVPQDICLAQEVLHLQSISNRLQVPRQKRLLVTPQNSLRCESVKLYVRPFHI